MKSPRAMAALVLTSSQLAYAQAPNGPVPGDEIVVQGQRTGAAGLADTTLILERRRDDQLKIEMDGDGTFRSFVNGRLHDRGKWRVDGELVCFDATRPGESSCASGIIGKRPGDEWDTTVPGGRRFKARLVAGT